MEAGGDNAVPAPRGVEDLVDTQFSREEAGDSEGVHSSTLDPGDGEPEDTGSKAKDQPSSLLSPLPQAEDPSSTCEHWQTTASDSSPTGEPESSSEGQGEDPKDGDPNDGDPSDEDWRSQWKHVFLLSELGKPIYSRYGSVEALLATMGVMTALVSFVQSAGDAIRAIYAEDHSWCSCSRAHSCWWLCPRLHSLQHSDEPSMPWLPAGA